MKIKDYLLYPLHRKDLKWKINHGFAQRGRIPAVKVETELEAKHIRRNQTIGIRRIINRKVTTAFVNDIVNTLINGSTTFNNYKYHDSGTGTNPESNSDTALQSPTGIARVVGTQQTGGSNNVYKSVAEITYNGSYAITEHGLFNASTNGTLMDRTVFSPINVMQNDKIQFTFTITFNPES